jgi:hypothetical protein
LVFFRGKVLFGVFSRRFPLDGFFFIFSLVNKVSLYSCLVRIAGADRAIPREIIGLLFNER